MSTLEKLGEHGPESFGSLSFDSAWNKVIVNVSALARDTRRKGNAELRSSSGALTRYDRPLHFEYDKYLLDPLNGPTHHDIRNLSLAGLTAASNDIGKGIDFRIGTNCLVFGSVQEIGLAFANQTSAHPRFNRINARTVTWSFACPTV